MRKLAVLILLCCMLTGCRQSSQVENQVFAVLMALDPAPGGGIRMTVMAPTMKSGSEEYTTATVQGQDLSDAVYRLRGLIPRTLNLTHTQLVIVSAALAETDGFPGLLKQIQASYPLCMAARLAITDGSAEEFLTAQKAIFGTRLSTGLVAMFEHYIAQSIIPDVTLSDAIAMLRAPYSSPIAISATRGDGSESPGSLRYDSANLYAGTALFSDGKYAGRLNGQDTSLMRLLRGDTGRFQFDSGTVTALVRPRYAPSVKITVSGIHIEMSVSAYHETGSEDDLRRSMEAGIMRVIRACQAIPCDPFRFAERAARAYPDLPSWIASDWMQRFSTLLVEVQVKIRSISA